MVILCIFVTFVILIRTLKIEFADQIILQVLNVFYAVGIDKQDAVFLDSQDF